MNTTNHLVLPDGRKLAYVEYGRPEGYPVLYFHGTPSSRLEPLLIGDDYFDQYGLRLIAPDRPGMGQSTFLPQRRFSDWPHDVLELANAMGLGQFSVLGYSGGCGYVAACAARIPDRLRTAVVVSGAWRMDWPEAMRNLPFQLRLLWGLAQKAPLLLSVMLKMTSIAFKKGRKQVKINGLPAADSAALARPGRLDAFTETLNEALIQGTKGAVWDMRLYVRAWDFELAEIQIPLHLFHGEQDVQVPVGLTRRVTGMVPAAQLVTYRDEGHLSTMINHFDEIAQTLGLGKP